VTARMLSPFRPVGRLNPAGTGMEYNRNIQLWQELEEAAARVQQEATAAFEEAERELELMRQEGEAEEIAAG
jgi:DNA-directed RNA polymerase subunit beta'